MSADNWRDCPRCATSKADRLAAAYGKVPEAVYSRMLKAQPPRETLREDREIGIWDGKFHVDYSGVCVGANSGNPADGCGFKFLFKHEEVVK